MESLRFTSNWNNKLECACFTSIRLRNDHRYFVGARFEIVLVNGSLQVIKGTCQLMNIRFLMLDQIDDMTAFVDTAYNASACREIIRKMYKNYSPPVDWKRQQLAVLLFRREIANPQQSLL